MNRMIALAVLPLLFSACLNDLQEQGGQDKALVFIAIGDTPVARTVMPDVPLDDAAYFILNGAFDNEPSAELARFYLSGMEEPVLLQPGAWRFTLNAYDADDAVILSGETEYTIAVGKTNRIVFYLSPPLNGGTGTIDITLYFPAAALIDTITVTTDGADAENFTGTDFTVTQDDTALHYSKQKAEGDYFISFALYDDQNDLWMRVSELVLVRGGLASSRVIDLSKYEETGETGLIAQLEWLKDHAKNKAYYIIDVTANETIDPQEPYRELYYDGKEVTLVLRGDTSGLELGLLSNTGAMFEIGSGVTLILGEITLQGLSNNTNSLVEVTAGGRLVMNAEAVITGNTCANAEGGGVGVREYGAFTMNGGTISLNSAQYGTGVSVAKNGTFTMNGGEISGNTGSSGVNVGGSFYLNGGLISGHLGGGVTIWEGNFIMSGGEISNNGKSGSSPSVAGGVYVGGEDSPGTFTMYGGLISENAVENDGGGVFVSGIFTLEGGTISGNQAVFSGGGINVISNGTFTMNGGLISGNRTTNTGTGGIGGGGVAIKDGGTFAMSGGIITDNTSPTIKNGGGVCMESNVTFTMTGGVITGYQTRTGNAITTIDLTATSPYTLVLDDNFEYGVGYQGRIAWADLLNANIMFGDQYELDIEFTVDRDLEDDLEMQIIDEKTTAKPNPYWTHLSTNRIIGPSVETEAVLADAEGQFDNYYTEADDAGPTVPGGNGFAAGVTHNWNGVIAIKRGAALADVILAFQTAGAGSKGTLGSGVKGPVTITFTRFVFTRVEDGTPGNTAGSGTAVYANGSNYINTTVGPNVYLHRNGNDFEGDWTQYRQ